MGLLERALKYKKQLNDSGRETLIDVIKGPAESGFIEKTNSEAVSIQDIDDFSFSSVDEVSKQDAITGTTDYIEKESFSEDFVQNEDSELPDLSDLDTTASSSGEKLFEEDIVFLNDEIVPQNSSKSDTVLSKNQTVKKPVEDELEITDQFTPETPVILGPEDKLSDNNYHMPEFNDYAVLYEMLKEFTLADSVEEIYGAVIFSIMGQLGVSSVSIITPDEEEPSKFVITESTGIKIPDTEIFWEASSGILDILNSYKGVLDIEEMKNDVDLREDYYRFISVNARLISPITFSENLTGVILVGEKIDSVDFTPPEIDFLHSLSEAASFAIKAKMNYDKANTELLGLRIEKEILWDVDIFQNALLSAGSITELKDTIVKNFYSLGMESYAIFLEEEYTGDYYPAYFENEDYLGFSDSGFRIKRDNRLAGFLLNKKTSIILDDFTESTVIIDTFGRERVEKMEVFISYPFIISGKLSGFITLFKINPAVEIIDVDIRLQRIVRFIFPYIYRLIELDPAKNIYRDLTAGFFSRFENEIKKSSDMNIPVAIISLSVKNYKRFYDRFGKIEMIKMFNCISDIIKERLNTGDFSARIDRQKFIIILPGKDKKYTATFSAILKNEIAGKFNTTEFKLLVTFISAVFPEDGKDIFSLLEIID